MNIDISTPSGQAMNLIVWAFLTPIALGFSFGVFCKFLTEPFSILFSSLRAWRYRRPPNKEY